jgi:hypothetical protein
MDSAATRPWLCPRTDCPSGTHDTYSAYRQGCRSLAATRDSSRYTKRGMFGLNPPRLVDPIGLVRRIEAAYFMGWNSFDIGERVGIGGKGVSTLRRRARRGELIQTSQLKRFVPELERLALTPAPDSLRAQRARNKARRDGFRPLLAWDDIDDPAEQPPPLVTDDLARRRQHPMSRKPVDVEIDEHLLDAVLDPLSSTRFDELSVPEQDHVVERLWRDAVARNFEHPSQRVAEQLDVDEPRRIQRIRERYRRRYQREQEAS